MPPVPSLIRCDQPFVPSPRRPGAWLDRQRLRYRLMARRPMPAWRVLRPVSPAERWTLLFLFLPGGALHPAQEFLLARMCLPGRRLLVVCAAPGPDAVPAAVLDGADAVIWKALPGFDFSGYTIGLRAIADASPGAEAFVLNDSVFGPLSDLGPVLARARWGLTGFLAAHQFERHVQSYAFVLQDVTRDRLAGLRTVFPARGCYDEILPVVFCQETRFARIASRHMTVGALWAGPEDGRDPSTAHPLALLDAGFPFAKRSLLGKHRDRVDEDQVRAALASRGVPAAALA